MSRRTQFLTDEAPLQDTATEKAIALMCALVEDRGQSALPAIAEQLGIPYSSARRITQQLARAALIERVGRGRYGAGTMLAELAAFASPKTRLANRTRASLDALARELDAIVHLGVLDGDMVTYLVRAGDPEAPIPTAPSIQFEAYCTAIGKVLLSELPRSARRAYLANGDFVAITDKTITDVDALKDELAKTRTRGFAIDDEEMFEGLTCLAVPLHYRGDAIAAISVSRTTDVLLAGRMKSDVRAARACASSLSVDLAAADGLAPLCAVGG